MRQGFGMGVLVAASVFSLAGQAAALSCAPPLFSRAMAVELVEAEVLAENSNDWPLAALWRKVTRKPPPSPHYEVKITDPLISGAQVGTVFSYEAKGRWPSGYVSHQIGQKVILRIGNTPLHNGQFLQYAGPDGYCGDGRGAVIRPLQAYLKERGALQANLAKAKPDIDLAYQALDKGWFWQDKPLHAQAAQYLQSNPPAPRHIAHTTAAEALRQGNPAQALSLLAKAQPGEHADVTAMRSLAIIQSGSLAGLSGTRPVFDGALWSLLVPAQGQYHWGYGGQQAGKLPPYPLNSLSASGLDLDGLVMRNITLSGADFSNARLKQASFEDATLSSANFLGADLAGASFNNTRIDSPTLNCATKAPADLMKHLNPGPQGCP